MARLAVLGSLALLAWSVPWPQVSRAVETCESPLPLLCDLTSEGFVRLGAGPLLTLRSRAGPIDELPGFPDPFLSRIRAGAFNTVAPGAYLLSIRRELLEAELLPAAGGDLMQALGLFDELAAHPALTPTQSGVIRALEAALALGQGGAQEGLEDFLAELPVPIGETLNAFLLEPGPGSSLSRFVLAFDPAIARGFPLLSGARLADFRLPLPSPDDIPTGTSDRVNEFGRGLAADADPGPKAALVPFFTGPDGRQNTPDDLPVFQSFEDCGPSESCGYQILTSGGSFVRVDTVSCPGGVCPFTIPQGLDEASCRDAAGNPGILNGLGQCLRVPFDPNGFLNSSGDAAIADDRRPATAFLEPPDLTGLRAGPLPARPRGIPISLPQVSTLHARRVDPETGAPVLSTGPLECKRAAGGPDGVIGTGPCSGIHLDPFACDDSVPFLGNCLLYEEGGAGVRRSPDQVALHHSANRTLFHALCTLTFDDDGGGCPLDQPNNNLALDALAKVLAGDPALGAIALLGVDTIRTLPSDTRIFFFEPGNSVTRSQLDELDTPTIAGALFGDVGDPANPTLGEPNLTQEQQALFGCGRAFLSGCDQQTAEALVVAGLLPAVAGGIDLMNADASVLTQEWSHLKSLTPHATIGQREDQALGSYFEAGVTRPALVDLSNDGILETPFTPAVLARIRSEASNPLTDVVDPRSGLPLRVFQVKGDFEIEAFVLSPDERWRKLGVLVYDPNSPNAEGENCTTTTAGGTRGPEPSCTGLEILSANVERLIITAENIGPDGAFDPPETIEELEAMLLGGASNLRADPISGPDGIFYNNADTDGDGLADTKPILALIDPNDPFSQLVSDPGACPEAGPPADPSVPYCYLDVTDQLIASGVIRESDATNLLRYVDPIPLQIPVKDASGARLLVDPHPPSSGGLERSSDVVAASGVPKLQPSELAQLVHAKRAADLARLPPADPSRLVMVESVGAGIRLLEMQETLFEDFFDPLERLFRDFDGNNVTDVDEDGDEVPDWLDDFTPGPISDDNVLCGSGIPRDPLQEALQVELYDASEYARIGELFGGFPLRPVGPEGQPGQLPPRSPVFCRGLISLLALAGESSPGRRDFLWHQPDTDADIRPDSLDNCPNVPNTDQADADGSGVGDACQCGDVDGNGLTNVVDALRIARGEVAPTDSNLAKCDVNGDAVCNVVDALRIARGEVGPSPEDQLCPAYLGPAGE